jgi:hypothetical protein
MRHNECNVDVVMAEAAVLRGFLCRSGEYDAGSRQHDKIGRPAIGLGIVEPEFQQVARKDVLDVEGRLIGA